MLASLLLGLSRLPSRRAPLYSRGTSRHQCHQCGRRIERLGSSCRHHNLQEAPRLRTNHACVIQRQSSQFARRVEQRVRPSALDRIHLLVNQRVYTTAEDVPPYEWKTPLERSIRAPQEAPRSHVPRQPRIWSDFHDHHQLCGPCISRRGRHLICVDQHR